METELDQSPDNTLIEKPFRRRLWISMLVALCAAILVYSFGYSRNFTSNIAFLIGFNVPITLVFLAVFRLALGKGFSGGTAQMTCAVIFVVLLAGSYIGFLRNAVSAKDALKSVEAGFDDVLASAVDEKGMPRVSDKPLDTKPTVSGDMGVIEQAMKQILNNTVAIQNEYLKQMDAIGWNTLLLPQRLKSDRSFKESREIIAKGRETVKVYRAKFLANLEAVKSQIMALDIDHNLKQGVIAGFDKNLDTSRASLMQVLDYEEKIVSEIEGIIDHLEASKKRWTVEGDTILFSKQEDLDAYNARLARIDAYGKKQQAVQQERIDFAKKSFKGQK